MGCWGISCINDALSCPEICCPVPYSAHTSWIWTAWIADKQVYGAVSQLVIFHHFMHTLCRLTTRKCLNEAYILLIVLEENYFLKKYLLLANSLCKRSRTSPGNVYQFRSSFFSQCQLFLYFCNFLSKNSFLTGSKIFNMAYIIISNELAFMRQIVWNRLQIIHRKKCKHDRIYKPKKT